MPENPAASAKEGHNPMEYSYSHSSRSIGAIFVACFGLAFSALCSWLFVTTGISPHFPRQSREIPLLEIHRVRASTNDPVALELHLLSGEIISLPPACIGREPERVLEAMTAMNPRIKALR